MKLGSSRGLDTKRPRGSERSKPCHQLRLTRRSLPPYPWPPEQAQPGVSKPCRTTIGASRTAADPDLAVLRHCQSKFYTACSRTRAGWTSTVLLRNHQRARPRTGRWRDDVCRESRPVVRQNPRPVPVQRMRRIHKERRARVDPKAGRSKEHPRPESSATPTMSLTSARSARLPRHARR